MKLKSKLTRAKGNMYDWVTHTHSHIGGKCSHECSYCYVQAMAEKFDNLKTKYSGDIRILEDSMEVDYGTGKTIFIDHMNDLFAENVTSEMIRQVLEHCGKYPDNTYVLQTKNPERYLPWIKFMPKKVVLGTTIESNRRHDCVTNAPSAFSRVIAMAEVSKSAETFITIEPILNFDVVDFADMLAYANPTFVNIGADSKDHGLDEPEYEKVMELYESLLAAKIEVRKKLNLDRLART